MARRHSFRRRPRPERSNARHDDEAYAADVDPRELAGMFAAPSWLRDAGTAAWLLVGICALLAALVALLALMDTIVMPVVTATIIAAVCSPLVRRLAGHMPRAAATVIVFLSLIVAGVGLIVLVLSGIVS